LGLSVVVVVVDAAGAAEVVDFVDVAGAAEVVDFVVVDLSFLAFLSLFVFVVLVLLSDFGASALADGAAAGVVGVAELAGATGAVP